VYHSMSRGKRGRGMVKAKRSRTRDRKTIVSTLAIALGVVGNKTRQRNNTFVIGRHVDNTINEWTEVVETWEPAVGLHELIFPWILVVEHGLGNPTAYFPSRSHCRPLATGVADYNQLVSGAKLSHCTL